MATVIEKLNRLKTVDFSILIGKLNGLRKDIESSQNEANNIESSTINKALSGVDISPVDLLQALESAKKRTG